ncbi:hypothetical protein Nepgr_007297 [Nepenthes gracilis]|uniref:Uncharacterized protein n=1 Tax=Nepenthes gracilis TaxID=150966 RepID=A0AAD3XI55_NEPGR|nr:hypothetical protein Nepgr_007297 [Nepenthes gracilis]
MVGKHLLPLGNSSLPQPGDGLSPLLENVVLLRLADGQCLLQGCSSSSCPGGLEHGIFTVGTDPIMDARPPFCLSSGGSSIVGTRIGEVKSWADA